MPTSTPKGHGSVADLISRSPISPVEPVAIAHGWEVSGARSDASLTLSDVTPLAKVLVRSDQTLFELPYGRAARDEDGTLVVGSAPNEWLLIGPPGEAASLAARVPRHGFTVVVDITHGRALMRTTGADAARMLSKVCAIDLGDHMAPHGAAFRASVAAVVTDVIRDDRDDTPSYLLHCERSSGQYLFDALMDAGTEFQIRIDGFPARH